MPVIAVMLYDYDSSVQLLLHYVTLFRILFEKASVFYWEFIFGTEQPFFTIVEKDVYSLISFGLLLTKLCSPPTWLILFTFMCLMCISFGFREVFWVIPYYFKDEDYYIFTFFALDDAYYWTFLTLQTSFRGSSSFLTLIKSANLVAVAVSTTDLGVESFRFIFVGFYLCG